jgi:D-inositol-3-phosphate glycosyltransferase
MNVYVRELATALAHEGVRCDVYTRRTDSLVPDEVVIEPGVRVRHIRAGANDLDKEALPAVVEQFAAGVATWIERDPVDAIHANYWLSADAGHRLKHLLNIPLAVTFHTLGAVKRDGGDHEPDFRIAAERQIIGCSDVVFSSCDVEAQQLQDFYGANPGRIAQLSPGVDLALFSPGQRWAARRALDVADTGRPLALFVGRLQPLKGLDVALKAIAASTQSPDLLVVGGPSGLDGERYVDELHKLAADLGISDRITWRPPQPHHVLSTYYRAADVCVVPSRSESFGLVALEAAACGTPVVASDVGGLSIIISDQVSGFLVADRSVAGFRDAIDHVVSDELTGLAMGAAAADRASAFSWRSAAHAFIDAVKTSRTTELVDCR